jgi:type I restriction enzyme S subunit
MSVPALRFKEFNENWQSDNLLSLSENGFTNGVFNDPSKVGSGYKIVNVLDMYIETTIDESKLKLVELNEAEFLKNKVEHGDVFFTRSSLVKEGIAHSNTYLGKSEDITFDGHLIRMRPKKDLINSSFINYLLKTSNPRSQLVKRGKTATMTTIGQADIAEVIVKYPSISEQTKIANFLTVVDEKISLLTQKHDLLNQYKKGVMQQIFSQELRFKDDDGGDFPEWEKVEFGNFFSFKTTNSYSRDCLNYSSGRVKNIHYGDIHTKFKSRFNVLIERVPFINENIETNKINSESFCIEGDLVIADASEDYKDIGKCIELVSLDNQLIVAGLHTFLARPTNGFFALGFMSHAMQSEAVRLQIMTIAQGTKVLSISTGRLSKVFVPKPNLKEQTKIANFLTAIDDKITATQTQLQAVKQYKQGLLQQMFV